MILPTRFLLACFGLSLVVSYFLWTWLRLWAYRQDLFAIRDDLWDRMHATGQLDSDEHRDLRDAINALIRLAPYLSLPTVVFAIFHPRESLSPIFHSATSHEDLDR